MRALRAGVVLAAAIAVGAACASSDDGGGGLLGADAAAPAVDGASGPADAGGDGAGDLDASYPYEPPMAAPASLVAALSNKPYVEVDCKPTTYPGWPFEAQVCTYGASLKVTVANPSPERVAAWIVESSTLIPPLDALRTKDPARWEEGLVVIARNVIGQSSRIFPLTGQIDEGTVYRFEKGVTRTCTTGCFCRINSTPRDVYCAWAAASRGEDEKACLAKYGTQTYTAAWADHCLDVHRAAWNRNQNDHFRARAHGAALFLAAELGKDAGAPDAAAKDAGAGEGAAVVAALKRYYPGP